MRDTPSAHASTNAMFSVAPSQWPMRPGSVSSGSTSIRPPIRTAALIGMPSDGGGVASGRLPRARLSQRAVTVLTRRAATADSSSSPSRKIGTTTMGGAPISIPASLVMVRGISFFAADGHPTK